MEICFKSYGCTANHNSTEIMKGLVRQAGFNLTANIDYADLVVINSCIVKEPTEEKIRRQIQDLLKQDKKIIIAGCMPRLNKDKLQSRNLFLLDTSQIKNLVNLIHDIYSNSYKEDKYIELRNEIKLNLPKIPKEKFIGITQISEGCFGKCTYCVTRLAKGKLFSYPKEEIIKSVKSDLDSYAREIWITSQDCANYENDKGKNSLPELLNEILSIKKNFYLRVGMCNPDNILKILPELLEVYKNKKMFKFLHVPLQSGSNKILKSMKRNYSKEDFIKIINEFRRIFPDIHISTDVIVGFPGETDEDFQQTFDLINKIKPETINVSKFWPRPKTLAEKMQPQINSEIKKQRAIKILKLHKEICNENQKKFINTEHEVIVDQKGFENTYLARNENYKLFAVHSTEKILGKKLKIKIKKTTPHYLIGEIIK
jgi:threonylcarbamoyladenosine tRNA methylthiotransferase CDKAL1